MTVPKDLIVEVRREFRELRSGSVYGDVEHFLDAFCATKVAYLTPDLRPMPRNPFSKAHFTAYVAQRLASLVGWLFVHRPVGDAVRAGIPRVVDALRDVLADERTTWEMPCFGRTAKQQAKLAKFVGGTPVPGRKGSLEGRDDGVVLLAPLTPPYPEHATSFGAFYTSRFADNVDRVEAFARAGSIKDAHAPNVAARIGSPGFAALAARVAKTRVPIGSYEANPLVSAKPVVAALVAKCRISPAAAALYLQTLALPAPSKLHVVRWNAWRETTYEAATAELVARHLVVRAKGDGSISVPKSLEKSKLAMVWHDLEGRIKHTVAEPCHRLFERCA